MRKSKGIYVHTHWGYNHPYAARTWTLDDWRGFLHGVASLGYNLVQIWPLIDTMPLPLSESDANHLMKIQRVIDIGQHEYGLTIIIGAGANVRAGGKARKYSFERRPYWDCEELVDPSDGDAVALLLSERRQLLEPLKQADGFWILDCDPGGYSGATSQQLVNLMVRHRLLLDSLREGIELVYWMWAGWQETSFEESWQNEPQDAWRDVVAGLAHHDPEPWRVNACWPGHFRTLQELGQLDRALYFPYNALEFEPSFPLTNWYPAEGDELWSAVQRIPNESYPRGIMANAQSHCLQLPHMYLFSHIADGGSLESLDLEGFAGRLLPKCAPQLSAAWTVLNENDHEAMRHASAQLDEIDRSTLHTGDLGGLLFGDPGRLIEDLIYQLRVVAELAALTNRSDQIGDTTAILARFHSAAVAWQRRTGFDEWARGPFMDRLQKSIEPLVPGIAGLPYDPRHGYSSRVLDFVKAHLDSRS